MKKLDVECFHKKFQSEQFSVIVKLSPLFCTLNGHLYTTEICLNMRSTLKQWQLISLKILEFQVNHIPTIPPMQGLEAMFYQVSGM
jgi:hypothetical protein